ncbi:MAG: uroporphyrinogen decarboxylase family protein [Anaerolineae bacterium]
MENRIARNMRRLADLFAGPFPGHAVIVDPEPIPAEWPGDYACGTRPVRDWLPRALKHYEAQLRVLAELDDDSVPTALMTTGTYLFAAAFGCQIHIYDDTPAAARPLVFSPAEADNLAEPDIFSEPLNRVFEFGELLEQRLGKEVPLGVPDIQSPFDIAALIWNKQDLYLALLTDPDAVLRLVAKTQRLLAGFLKALQARFPQLNMCHCPHAWAPMPQGVWLSEDEAGAMSPLMFARFCLPSLRELSADFGGLFLHCCASADYQYPGFASLPNLRGLNRVITESDPASLVRTFAGKAVLMQAWMEEDAINQLLDLALPQSRFLFNLSGRPLEEIKPVYERLREQCPRLYDQIDQDLETG